MASNKEPNQTMVITEKNKIKDEKRQFAKEQKEQRKEAKKRAKEIAKRESEINDGEGGGVTAFFATLTIVLVWLAIIAIVIKLDVGGFGSSVLTPILKDVPILNTILPNYRLTETDNPEAYGGYTNLQEAVEQIKLLEGELERANVTNQTQALKVSELTEEVERLKAFEEKQTDFQRVMTEFYEEVVYADKGPGIEAYQKYYEAMDPATAEYIYKQVVVEMEADQVVQNYAAAYSAMKPKQAAGIMEEMTDDLELAAKILNAMDATSRGEILGVMDASIAAQLTKIMEP